MPELHTDEQLLSRFAKGDDSALGELARRHELHLLGLARGLLDGRDDLARDVVQETWVRVIGAAKNFAGNSAVKTWLYRILINRATDLRTRAAKLDRGLPGNVAQSNGHEPPPEAALESGEQADSLRTAVAALSPDKRLILLLSYHEGHSHESAAEVLGIPLGTLKSRLHSALEELRSRLGTQETTQ